jgi:uncharacterized protein (DUF2164 family)
MLPCSFSALMSLHFLLKRLKFDAYHDGVFAANSQFRERLENAEKSSANWRLHLNIR